MRNGWKSTESARRSVNCGLTMDRGQNISNRVSQSNFIHKILRQGKLQLTCGPRSTKSKIVEHVESRIRKSWYSQHFLGRDKTLKGGNLKLRLGLDPSSKLRAFSQEKVKCSCIQTYLYLRQLWQAFLSFDQIFARIITCRCHIHLEYINAPNIVRPDSLTHQNCSTSKH